MKTRRIIFFDLIKSIFEKGNVRFSGNMIVTNGNQVSETKFNISAQQKFTKIFVAAYSGMKIVSNSKPENEKTIELYKLIQNSNIYFQSLEIDIDEKRLNSISDKVKAKMFCHAITKKILPFVFDGNDPDEDAENEFELVVRSLKLYFDSFELGYMVHEYARAKDVETINDSKYMRYINQKKDLYAVPIDRGVVINMIIVSIHIAAISIAKKLDDEERYTLKSLIGAYQKYPFKDDELFIDPFEIRIDSSNKANVRYDRDSYFPLSPIVIRPQYFIPKCFYYITPINDSIINEYKIEYGKEYEKYGPYNFTHDDLDRLLHIRAAEDYRMKHRREISEYYEQVLKYVEDVIHRITTANYSNIIRKDSSDVKACQELTKHFNIDYEKILSYIEEDDCVLKCYELIECELKSFISSFERCIPKLSEDLCIFLPDNIKQHYAFIGNELKSANLSDAIKLRDKIINDSTVNFKNIKKSNMQENIGNNENVDFNLKSKNSVDLETTRRYLKLAEEISNSKENLYRRIFDVLNKYYDNIENTIKE
ncbi:hypothetical protein SAMN02910265_00990 [Ruminococcus flavefaciens]|uniref:Uncharacterized protein n=1 Tax=Ruminococcus flavefaciens TaxID=1265 RepID=A0A1H6IKP4_RUMFL|nr:hypothetical protein [Ruminococcus flavefaciens]SEH48523.1 hypothetical protein SAMN02910265_00990 [Ruminococcus flavefaciens]